MKLVEPDLAMVPKLLIKSYLVIPIPESVIDKVLASLSYSTLISSSYFSFTESGSETDKNLILSRASEALEINSLKKISFCVYKLFMIISINRPTSA